MFADKEKTVGLKALLNKDDVVGLDIGTGYVSMVQTSRRKDQYVITGAATAEIIPDQHDSFQMRQIKQARAITQCYNQAKITAVNAVCGLSGPEVAVRKFEFPQLSQEELESAVMLEASQVCPFDISDAVVDYQLLNQQDSKIRGILVSATNRLIKRKKQLAKAAALNCVLMDVDGLALLNCLLQYHQNHSAVSAVINIAHDGAIAAVVVEAGEPFIRDLNYTQGSIFSHIERIAGVSAAQARQMLDDFEKTGQAEPALSQVLERASAKLAADIMDTLKYHAAQQSIKGVKEVLICGSCGQAFFPLLEPKLEADVQLWNPFDRLECADPAYADILRTRGPAMAIAAGLSMRRI